MASTGAGYDLGATTFSPDGRIFQVEYATKAVENSGTVIGIRCSDGVVLGVEKVIFSKMLLPSSNRRVATVAPHVGVAQAGLAADGRQVVARAREECDSYEETYGIPMPPSVLAQRLGEYVHYFTIHGALRPFGSSTMFAGYDERQKTHQLYVLEPTGVCLRYFGAALGKGRQSAKSEIEKLDLSKLTCREALKEIAKMIYTVYDESKDKPFILEFAWLTEATEWKYKLVPQDLIDEAEAWAKKELEDDDDDDDEEEDAMETS
jgi:20S proteasome subunit alpha 7